MIIISLGSFKDKNALKIKYQEKSKTNNIMKTVEE